MSDQVMTVLGPVKGDQLGRVLPHEHIASACGPDPRMPGLLQDDGTRYKHEHPRSDDERALFTERLLNHYGPMLTTLKLKHDCRTIVEVSPEGIRQDVDLELWAELSRRTGVHIVASTGYYTSGYRPESFVGASAQQLADGMIREATAGFGATGLRAGIIKIALEDFGAGDRKLCQAAALTHHATGLAITTHVCSPQVRRATLDYLEGAGVPAERIVLGHADDNATLLELLGLVERGCSVLFTIWGIHTRERIGWAYPVLPRHHSAGLVAGLVAEGFGDRVMASIDYWAGFQNGQVTEYRYDTDWTGRDYLYLFGFVVDSLRTMGVPEAAIERMLRDNPRRMLEV